jgi:3-hydroxybutyryl-CoA dehydrogenase
MAGSAGSQGSQALAEKLRVAIIGAGPGEPFSGAEIALFCAQAGHTTVLEDVLPGNLRKAQAWLTPELLPSSSWGSHSESQAAPVPEASSQLVRYAQTIEEAVRDADLIVDTVPDELESKLEILSLLDRMAPPSALFVTPTRVLSIRDLASCTYRPTQCFGLQFAGREPLVVQLTVVPGVSAANLERVEAFLRSLGALVLTDEDTRSLP